MSTERSHTIGVGAKLSVFMAVILFRPQGLLGRKVERKV